VIFDGFVGPSSTLHSVNADAERTINLYLEIPDGGAKAKSQAQLKGTPGLRPFLAAVGGVAGNTLAESPVRALWHEDGRCFAIAGGKLYELFANQTATSRGSVANDTRPATISSNGRDNGHQLFITSGGLGYIYDLNANTLTQITAPAFPTPVIQGAYVDGYFIALKANSNRFQLSALLDGLTWSGLDVAQVSESSDLVVSMVVDHREVWLFGSRTTVPWFNNGNASFPFAPVQGAFIEGGIIAPFSAVKIDNSVFWLDQDARGAGIVRRAHGYTPQRISHHALEESLRGVFLEDAIGWAYQEAGHTFYVLYVPAHDTHWVYDTATQQWHERALWDAVNARWTPDLGRCHCFAFNKHLVGDRQSGAVYEMSLDLYDYEVVVAAA
jgi:hypothetical protein